MVNILSPEQASRDERHLLGKDITELKCIMLNRQAAFVISGNERQQEKKNRNRKMNRQVPPEMASAASAIVHSTTASL